MRKAQPVSSGPLEQELIQGLVVVWGFLLWDSKKEFGCKGERHQWVSVLIDRLPSWKPLLYMSLPTTHLILVMHTTHHRVIKDE